MARWAEKRSRRGGVAYEGEYLPESLPYAAPQASLASQAAPPQPSMSLRELIDLRQQQRRNEAQSSGTHSGRVYQTGVYDSAAPGSGAFSTAVYDTAGQAYLLYNPGVQGTSSPLYDTRIQGVGSYDAGGYIAGVPEPTAGYGPGVHSTVPFYTAVQNKSSYDASAYGTGVRTAVAAPMQQFSSLAGRLRFLKSKPQPKTPSKANSEPLDGLIFGCNNQTKQECFRRKLFGLPAARLAAVQRIVPGTRLFLFNFDEKVLYGIFEAVTDGAPHIVPDAFSGSYPAQVRMRCVKRCEPLTIEVFKPAMASNFFTANKFNYELSADQVSELVALFEASNGGLAAPSGGRLSKKQQQEQQQQRTLSPHLSPHPSPSDPLEASPLARRQRKRLASSNPPSPDTTQSPLSRAPPATEAGNEKKVKLKLADPTAAAVMLDQAAKKIALRMEGGQENGGNKRRRQGTEGGLIVEEKEVEEEEEEDEEGEEEESTRAGTGAGSQGTGANGSPAGQTEAAEGSRGEGSSGVLLPFAGRVMITKSKAKRGGGQGVSIAPEDFVKELEIAAGLKRGSLTEAAARVTFKKIPGRTTGSAAPRSADPFDTSTTPGNAREGDAAAPAVPSSSSQEASLEASLLPMAQAESAAPSGPPCVDDEMENQGKFQTTSAAEVEITDANVAGTEGLSTVEAALPSVQPVVSALVGDLPNATENTTEIASEEPPEIQRTEAAEPMTCATAMEVGDGGVKSEGEGKGEGGGDMEGEGKREGDKEGGGEGETGAVKEDQGRGSNEEQGRTTESAQDTTTINPAVTVSSGETSTLSRTCQMRERP
eukprot:TRINITY_DN1935_c1_g2_i1.p1 TRINITY_DN1935_c1_g2~~TRINITY_DN1935_c1_g2_i1.p1  ORF type:complete len:820 (+),score=168.72 TRINITY_DN1935_c1_g2_i1:239-2698(+)